MCFSFGKISENLLTFLCSYIIIRLYPQRKGGKIFGNKKGTKLTDSPKSHMLRVRMDNESMMKLDVICETKNITRSEVVREGIEQQYAKLKK